MLCKNFRSAAKNSHTGLFFHPAGAALVRTPLINKTKKPFGGFHPPKGFGGGRGIRTPVPLPTNGFQDRLVMTASICLRVELKLTLSSIYQLR